MFDLLSNNWILNILWSILSGEKSAQTADPGSSGASYLLHADLNDSQIPLRSVLLYKDIEIGISYPSKGEDSSRWHLAVIQILLHILYCIEYVIEFE